MKICASLINSIHLLPAPSAAPSNVSVSEVTSSNITVQWGAVDCIHRNGDITGYTIMYMYTILGSANTETLTVSGGSADSVTISSGIESNTTYTIQVAASTIVGTGPFSNPVDIHTDSKPVVKLLYNCCKTLVKLL